MNVELNFISDLAAISPYIYILQFYMPKTANRLLWHRTEQQRY